MGDRRALVTGAAGEMGHLLIPSLVERGFEVVTVDLRDLPPELAGQCRENVHASINDREEMERLFAENRFSHIYHLAAILSTKAERVCGDSSTRGFSTLIKTLELPSCRYACEPVSREEHTEDSVPLKRGLGYPS